ncbi:MAG: DUF808 domain-containing protein [Gemmatimonadetes bacterium]|nr:DUF808 domain-containing protein [Gemmatimonadota bacterium]
MASSLLALLDDITSLLDDVATLTKVAATKTSGVMGDDLALNAQQVAGFAAERELPVVWAVAKGSFVNKLILVPAALAISAFVPAAVLPLLMIGGLFLCYEGVEKLLHKWMHRGEPAEPSLAHAIIEEAPEADIAALEKTRVKGAVRTDFVLSAEIIVITLGTLAGEPLVRQVTVLSLIGIAATVFVYGIVAGIVKIDDLGLRLVRRGGASVRAGELLLATAPRLMRALSVLGTAAMFTVGGHIIVEGVPPIHHAIEGVVESLHGAGGVVTWIVSTVLDAVVGVASGALVVAVVMAGKKLFARTPAAA